MTVKPAMIRVVNGTKHGEWSRKGLSLFAAVEFAWAILMKNSHDLQNLLQLPSQRPVKFSRILTGGPNDSWDFWATLNQRLHNYVASITTLVDQLRKLERYYENDAPEIVEELRSQNAKVRELPEAVLLRELRNFMLHSGQPPLVTHIQMTSTFEPRMKLDAASMLKDPFKSSFPKSRKSLRLFRDNDGPDIETLLLVYTSAMDDLCKWLFEQRGKLAATTPDRFFEEMDRKGFERSLHRSKLSGGQRDEG